MPEENHTAPPGHEDALHTLLDQGAAIYQHIGPFCEESLALLKLEGQLAVKSAVAGSQLLVLAVIAAITCWLGLNVAAIAGLHEVGLPLSLAILLVSTLDALLAIWAYWQAGRCVEDMRFSRSLALLRGRHAPR